MKLDNSKNNKNNIYKRSKTSFIKKAFTLIELVVVIAVIAILAGVGVATYFAVNNSANRSATEQNLVEIQNVYSLYKIEKEEEINDLSLEDSAYNFISSYLPSQGITNRDTDLINYIVLKRKTNNDDLLRKSSLSNNIVSDEKIVYVTTKPSYGYFIEEDVMSGDRLENTKIFDNEEDMIKAIQEDKRFSEYDTSFLKTYGIEASKELQDYDLDQDGIIQEDEIGRKAIKVKLNYDNGDVKTYYLKNGESILDCDNRYLNGQGQSSFNTQAALSNTVAPFTPYGVDDEKNRIYMNTAIYLTKDDIANYIPNTGDFLNGDDAGKMYEDSNTNKLYDGNIITIKTINLSDLVLTTPKVNLYNFEASIKNANGSGTEMFGSFKEIVEYSRNLDKNNYWNIFIGTDAVADGNDFENGIINLPDNVKIKIPYSVDVKTTTVTRYNGNVNFNNIKGEPGHLSIVNGANLVINYKGVKTTPVLTGAWFYGTDGGLSVLSQLNWTEPGKPMVFLSAGELEITEGCKVTLNNDVWMRAYGYIYGEGELIVNTGAKVVESMTVYDWMLDDYYGVGDKYTFTPLSSRLTDIFPFQKYSFNNIVCTTKYYKNASLIAWITLYWKGDHNIYFTFLGDVNASNDEVGFEKGKDGGQGVKLEALFGISEESTNSFIEVTKYKDNIMIDDGKTQYDTETSNCILNYIRHYKSKFEFINSTAVLGNFRIVEALGGVITKDIFEFRFPIYNMEMIFNGKVNLRNEKEDEYLRINVLPGSKIYIQNLNNFVCGEIVCFDDFNYFSTSSTNGITTNANFVNVIDNALPGYVEIGSFDVNGSKLSNKIVGSIKLNDSSKSFDDLNEFLRNVGTSANIEVTKKITGNALMVVQCETQEITISVKQFQE